MIGALLYCASCFGIVYVAAKICNKEDQKIVAGNKRLDEFRLERDPFKPINLVLQKSEAALHNDEAIEKAKQAVSNFVQNKTDKNWAKLPFDVMVKISSPTVQQEKMAQLVMQDTKARERVLYMWELERAKKWKKELRERTLLEEYRIRKGSL